MNTSVPFARGEGAVAESSQASTKPPAAPKPAPETGGPKGPEPTRYGDWERAGRCVDF